MVGGQLVEAEQQGWPVLSGESDTFTSSREAEIPLSSVASATLYEPSAFILSRGSDKQGSSLKHRGKRGSCRARDTHETHEGVKK